MLAWTAGQTSVELRTALPGARTRRLEATHAARTAVLVACAIAVVVLPGMLEIRPSPLGLVLVVAGGLALTAGLVLE